MSEHLDQQARNGRLIDERIMRIASVPDPFFSDKSINFAWEGEKAPESVLYARRQSGDKASSTTMAVQHGGGALSAPETTKRVTGGSGYQGAFNVSNMYREDNGCSTTWFVPGYASSRDHKLVSCYEVWAQDKTVHWIYNRWALWTPAPPSTVDERAYTTDFYVAARPWKGHEYKIVKTNNWAPRSQDLNKSCDNIATLNLGGTYGGVNAGLSIPINSCSSMWLDINTNSHKIGIDFDGSRQGQLGMDVAGDFNSVDRYVLPYWADYNWVEVKWCWGWGAICDPPSALVKKDSGW